MAFEFKFPDVGEGIHEGTIVKLHVKENDEIKSEQIIADIETDKAVVEIPSPKAGTILKLYHKEGEVIKVGEVLAVIGEKGEKVPERNEEHYTGSVVGFLEEAKDVAHPKQKAASSSQKINDGTLATPKARKLAKELNVDLSQIKGTGANGVITDDDVLKSRSGTTPVKKIEVFGTVERVQLKGIRKITAERMREAVSNAALVTHHDHVDVTDLYELRKKINEKAADKKNHLTYLPFVIKSTIESLKKHPYVASSVEGNEIILKKYYNIGVACDTPDGLMVPVVKDADKKSLYNLASEISSFVEKAKTRKIDLADLKGGVFTITNIGVIGSTYFTPIINFPESCILGTGRVEDMPVVKDGKVVVRKVMPVSFTYDHRVLDGAEAARFINDIITLLQNPDSLMK